MERARDLQASAGDTRRSRSEPRRRSNRAARGARRRLPLGIALLALLALAPAAARAAEGGGAVVAFGKNGLGELGVGFRDKYEDTPITAVGATHVKQIAQGFNFTLALLSNGTVESWGENNYGQLGLGKLDEPRRCMVPRLIPGLTEVLAVAAAGVHAMALLANGTVETWGVAQAGELGDGRSGLDKEEEQGEAGGGEEEPPNEEGEEKEEEEVSAFEEMGCEGPKSPVTLEEPGRQPKPVPTAKMPAAVKAIAAGGASDYALLENGEVEAWGENKEGQLGRPSASTPEKEACEFNGEPHEEAKERKRHKAEKFRANRSSCPRLCLLEIGVYPCRAKPHLVEQPGKEEEYSEEAGAPPEGTNALHGVVEIAAGEESTYAVVAEEVDHVVHTHLLAWGGNGRGELGTGGEGGPKPASVTGLSEISKVSAGTHHALALSHGELFGWGNAANGDLTGRGEKQTCGAASSPTPCYRKPHAISGLPAGTIEAIDGGADDSFVVIGHGAYAFGANEFGKLGIGSTKASKKPRAISGIAAVAQVSAAETRTSVLLVEDDAPAPTLELTSEPGGLQVKWRVSSSKVKVRQTPVPCAEEGFEYSPLRSVTGKEAGFGWPNASEPNYLEERRYEVIVTESGGKGTQRKTFGVPMVGPDGPGGSACSG